MELERAELLVERIVRAAAASPQVLAQVPAAQRCELQRGHVLVDAAVGWLEPAPAGADEDPVVRDRLDRAAYAEFGSHDLAAAEREFDTLLAGALPSRQRLVVLAAAAWQANRAGRDRRRDTLGEQLDALLTDVKPAELKSPQLANAVAAAARLPRPNPTATWFAQLIAALPPAMANSLPDTTPGLGENATVAARRELLRIVEATLTERTPNGPELRAQPDGRVVWFLRDAAAVLATTEFVTAAREAGRRGELPEWPWLVEPAFGEGSFGDVPGLRGVVPSQAYAFADRPWLLPAITAALLLAFAGALWQQVRAMRRESAAVRTQAEFLTTVTHELKTPLASIRLLGEMLAEGRAKGREDEYYRMLAGEAGRLSMLIENVLDLGRLERGERAYDLRPVDVGEVVTETLRLFAPVAAQAGLRVVWHDGSGGPMLAHVDRGALVQALVSVLDNARKYGGKSAGSEADIEVATSRRDGALAIDVEDHGTGVPADERERIFARFVRGRDHAHGAVPGVGIGLYLARTIARRLGGDLVCTARASGEAGARFTFSLPAETAS